jgi:hypothetical protein
MGEVQGTLFPLEFNHSLKLRSTPEGLTADAGAVLLREVGERLGLWKLLEEALADSRDPELITHPFGELLRTAVLLAAQGWSSQRDVDFLRLDPAFRLAVSKRRGESPLLARRHGREPEGLASQPTLSRLMAALSESENRKALVEVLCAWAAHRAGLSREFPREEITVDLDSLPTEVHGHQPGSAYNGHYRCCCFHPLVVSWEFGDFLGGMLREGNVHTSTDALEFILPYLGWAAGFAKRVWLRMDAGFPSEPFLSALEKQGHRYVARLRTNARLERMAWPHVDRIANKDVPEELTHTVELTYQAGPWSRARRVVLIIEERPLELMPHYFFLITNASPEEEDGMELVGRYRQRGSTEKEYGEWMGALDVALSSTNRPKETYGGERPRKRSEPVDSFAVNEAALLLSMVAANLLHTGRLLARRSQARLWSRETFRKYVLKAPARVARSSRYVTLWIQEQWAGHWTHIGRELKRLYPARGSPVLQALPSPA